MKRLCWWCTDKNKKLRPKQLFLSKNRLFSARNKFLNIILRNPVLKSDSNNHCNNLVVTGQTFQLLKPTPHSHEIHFLGGYSRRQHQTFNFFPISLPPPIRPHAASYSANSHSSSSSLALSTQTWTNVPTAAIKSNSSGDTPHPYQPEYPGIVPAPHTQALTTSRPDHTNLFNRLGKCPSVTNGNRNGDRRHQNTSEQNKSACLPKIVSEIA